MNTIVKKILSISLGVSVLASCVSCFASEETSVPIEEYMYDAKTVFVDDDLDINRTKKISAFLNASNTVEEDDGNIAITRKDWEAFDVVARGNFIDADKVVLAFDIKPSGVSFEEATATGTFDKTKRSFVAYGIYAGGASENGKLGMYSGTTIASQANSLSGWINWGTGSSTGANITVYQTNDDNNGYVRVVAVYERVKDSSGSSKVYMRNLMFNGKDVLNNTLRASSSSLANWWSDDSNYPFRIQCRTGSGTLPLYFDNILLYEPYDFGIKEMEYSPDFSSADLAFTLGVNTDEGSVQLIDEDGTTDCSMIAGNSKKQAVVNFGKSLDLESKSYYMNIKGIKSVNGDSMDGQNYLISKKYADVNETNAMYLGGEEMAARLNVAPMCDETAYAVASIYSGDDCIDYAIQKVQLSTSSADQDIVFEIKSQEAPSADKIKMFLVDDLENMKIVSDVVETEVQ